MLGEIRITQKEAQERLQELLNSQPTLKQAFEEQGWEGLETFSDDPVAQEVLEWKSCL